MTVPTDPDVVFKATVKMVAEIEDDGSPETAAFWGSRTKIARARHLIAEFSNIVDTHFREFPPKLTFDFAPDQAPGTGNILIHTKAIRLPVASGAIIGDVIHNLRAALNLMAVELVEAVEGNPSEVKFPFGKDEAHFRGQLKDKKFHRAGEEAVRLITQFAPYAGGNDALRAIHDLDIQDKHVALAPATTVAIGRMTVGPGRHENEAFYIGPGEEPVVRVAFPDSGLFAGQDVVPTLENSVELVESIVDAFAALVPDWKSGGGKGDV